MLNPARISIPLRFLLLALPALAIAVAVLSSPAAPTAFAKPPTATPTATSPTLTPTTRPPTPTNAPTSSACPTIVDMALNKSYTSSVAASSTYPDTGGVELTDGVYAAPIYTDPAWQGRTSNYYQTVDLGQNCLVGVFQINFYQDTTAGIYYPSKVTFSFSTDGTNFTDIPDAVRDPSSGLFKSTVNPEITVRWVRVTVNGSGWIFEDELEARHLATPTPTGPTPTPAPTRTPGNNTNVWQGSFFQPSLTDPWTATNFATEFQYMWDVKMDHAIWQWTADSKDSKPVHMWPYYPTTLAAFHQKNSYDAVGVSLAQAQAKGLKIWLGLNWDDDWWSKYANDNTWLTTQFGYSKQIAQELWNRYGGQYGNTIAGFYLTMEMDNVNFTTTTTQDRMIAVYTDTANYIHTNTGKPVMVAPFFNTSIGQDAQTYANMWGYIVANAPIDVVAVQDGIGVGHSTLANIGSWLSPLRNAIKAARPSTQFWSDLETLNPDYTTAPVSRVIDQLNAEKAYVDKFTTFSFNHYGSPQQGNKTEYTDWKAYTDTH